MITKGMPYCFRARAATKPHGPAPTMITGSCSAVSGRDRSVSELLVEDEIASALDCFSVVDRVMMIVNVVVVVVVVVDGWW